MLTAQLLVLAATASVALSRRTVDLNARDSSAVEFCKPVVNPDFRINFRSNLNSTQILGTYDCEACTSLGVYNPEYVGINDMFIPATTDNPAFIALQTPNYSNQCLTKSTQEGAVSPFYRSPCVTDDVNQAFFSFKCSTCNIDDATLGTGCSIQYTDPKVSIPFCLQSEGKLNVGGLSLVNCDGSLGQLVSLRRPFYTFHPLSLSQKVSYRWREMEQRYPSIDFTDPTNPFISIPHPLNLRLTLPSDSDLTPLVETLNSPLVAPNLRSPPFPYKDSDGKGFISVAKSDAETVLSAWKRGEWSGDGLPSGCFLNTIRTSEGLWIGAVGIRRWPYDEVLELEKKETLVHEMQSRKLGDKDLIWTIGSRKVRATVYVGNIGSRRVFEKNDFKLVDSIWVNVGKDRGGHMREEEWWEWSK
ncbi:hypothetical protein T439DRAFT_334002 [Meredithblackwellia eburnea MCA 4105]